MATLTRAHGGVDVGVELVGRNLSFVTVSSTGIDTTPGNVDSNLEKILFAISQTCTIEAIGTPTAGAVRIAVSGGAVPADADLTSAKTGAANNATTAAFAF
jgi:hypothetical protein